MKLEFIGSKAQSVPGAVVYPSALGNTLVCLQQLELQRRREGGKSAVLTCSCAESMGGKEKGRGTEKEGAMWSWPGKWIHMSGGLCELIG